MSARSSIEKWYGYLVGAIVAVFLLVVFFLGGVAVGEYRIFPYSFLMEIKDAARSVKDSAKVLLGKKLFEHEAPKRAVAVVPVWDKGLAYNGLTFMTAFENGKYGAKLVDMEGKVLHRWDFAFSKAFPDDSHVKFRVPDEANGVMGAHMFPNGDVVFTFNGGNFPDGGLVKIDKCSNVLWSNPTFTNHAINITPEGDIWAPIHTFHEDYNPHWVHLQPPYYEDGIAKFSAKDGRELDRISILDAIYDSKREGLLTATASTDIEIMSRDPLHTNDVEVVTEATAHAVPGLKVGDLMVSLRDLNAIVFIDPDTKKIKWSVSGITLKQHDPDLLPNGHIVAFDNRWEEPSSRLVEFDPLSQQVVWEFSGTADDNFYQRIRGMEQYLPNGNVITVEPEEGRVIEIDRNLGNKIVWEYYNITQPGWVGEVSQAIRVLDKDVTFLGGSC